MLDWKAAKFHTFKLSLLGKKVIKLTWTSHAPLPFITGLTMQSMYGTGAHLSLLWSRWGVPLLQRSKHQRAKHQQNSTVLQPGSTV
jgi:hypothetical protein